MQNLTNFSDKKISVRRLVLEDLTDAKFMFTEYFDAINVLLRDDDIAIRNLISNPGSGIWMAYVDGMAAGCVALRPLPSIDGAAECKRLYVRQVFRRQGVAEALIATMEHDATTFGYQTIYLDSKDDLYAAIAVYERAGYYRCARYNDNPQATLFMSKTLSNGNN
jgi:GNAT superfamily N-acetyltransferase